MVRYGYWLTFTLAAALRLMSGVIFHVVCQTDRLQGARRSYARICCVDDLTGHDRIVTLEPQMNTDKHRWIDTQGG